MTAADDARTRMIDNARTHEHWAARQAADEMTCDIGHCHTPHIVKITWRGHRLCSKHWHDAMTPGHWLNETEQRSAQRKPVERATQQVVDAIEKTVSQWRHEHVARH